MMAIEFKSGMEHPCLKSVALNRPLGIRSENFTSSVLRFRAEELNHFVNRIIVGHIDTYHQMGLWSSVCQFIERIQIKTTLPNVFPHRYIHINSELDKCHAMIGRVHENRKS